MATVTNAQIKAIPGWFGGLDVPAFRLLLAETAVRLGGDLAELGVYQGKSAVLLGAYLNSGETLTVVDLFGTEASADGNKRENAEQYPNLTRAQFEHAYQRVHGNLPVVIEGYSSSITQYAAAAAHRLVHVDASHLYEHVVTDIESARTLLKPDGSRCLTTTVVATRRGWLRRFGKRREAECAPSCLRLKSYKGYPDHGSNLRV